MKWSIILSFLACAEFAVGEFSIPPQVENAIANDAWGANIQPALDRDGLRRYFRENWRVIIDHFGKLPLYKVDPTYNVTNGLGSISKFIGDCEGLSPEEYLDFTEAMLSGIEQKSIPQSALEYVMGGYYEKHDFFAVNYNHPRVAVLLKRAIALVPKEDPILLECLEKVANGSLADNYMTNRDTDAPLPQTLPGIKLKRPWGSLIKKYERLTGKKVPPDPNFPDEGSSARSKKPRQVLDKNADSDGAGEPPESAVHQVGKWAAVLAATIAVVAAVAQLVRRKTRHTP